MKANFMFLFFSVLFVEETYTYKHLLFHLDFIAFSPKHNAIIVIVNFAKFNRMAVNSLVPCSSTCGPGPDSIIWEPDTESQVQPQAHCIRICISTRSPGESYSR